MRSLEERFWSKVEITGFCWLWTGSTSNGYGSIFITKKDVETGKRRVGLAHRIAYQLLIGPIPQGLELDHLCRVRLCVNPDHLEAVTRRTNTLRSPVAPAALNARKTHCLRGHLYDEANTGRQEGRRFCRRCVAASQQAYRLRLRNRPC